MQRILKQIAITIRELSDLLLVNERTLHSWFSRNGKFPSASSDYLSTLELYEYQYAQQDLADWQLPLHQQLVKTHIKNWEANIETLKKQHTRLQHEQSLIHKKWQQQVKRIHFATHYQALLPPHLRDVPLTTDWLQMIERKSRFEAQKQWLKLQKLSQKMAGIAGELAFLETIAKGN